MALTAEQQAVRLGGISGSEISAVAGLSPYARPIDVWRSKMGLAPEREVTEHMLRGTHLGPALITWMAEKLGKTITHFGPHEETLVSARWPIVRATPDGRIHSAGRSSRVEKSAETKAPGIRTAHKYGEPGTDDVPDEVIPQCQFEMAVLEVDECIVGALLDGELQLYTVRWDEELFHVLRERAEQFWTDYVMTKTPPPPDGTTNYSEYLKDRFPRSNATMIQADAETRAILEMYRDAREVLERCEQRADEMKQRLQEAIGNADGIEAEGIGRATWRICKGRESLDVASLKAEVGEETIKKHMRQGAGYRRFLATFKG